MILRERLSVILAAKRQKEGGLTIRSLGTLPRGGGTRIVTELITELGEPKERRRCREKRHYVVINVISHNTL